VLATKGIPLRIAADREKGRASWRQAGLPAQSLRRHRFRRAHVSFSESPAYLFTLSFLRQPWVGWILTLHLEDVAGWSHDCSLHQAARLSGGKAYSSESVKMWSL